MNIGFLQQMMRGISTFFAIVVSISIVSATPSAAQNVRHFEKEAIIALVDDSRLTASTPLVASSGGEANTRWILRFPEGKQRNIIALRRSTATSGLLLESIRSLQALQASRGDKPKGVQLLAIHDRLGEAPDKDTRALFDRLSRARTFQIRGLGETQALVIRVQRDSTEK